MSMKKGIILLLLCSVVLTGCWDRRELNELAITLAIGIDEPDDQSGNKYLVSAQIVVPIEVSVKGSKGSAPVVSIKAEGKTVFEATQKLAKQSPREMYPGHLRVLVISEGVAEKGIDEILDYFSRNWELRSDYYILIAKDMKAENLLNVMTPLETLPANNMYNKVNVASEYWSSTRGVTIDDLIMDIEDEGREAVLTGIEVLGDPEIGTTIQNTEAIEPPTVIRLTDLGVFKGDKFVGWLTEKESTGYNKITNQVKSSVSTITCPDGGTIAIKLNKSNVELKGKVKNGTPEIDLTLHSKGSIMEVNCDLDLTKTETISMLEKLYKEELKKVLETSISSLQEDFQSDIYGFGEAIRQADPKSWEKLKGDWDQEFSNLQVNIKIDAKILKMGAISNSKK